MLNGRWEGSEAFRGEEWKGRLQEPRERALVREETRSKDGQSNEEMALAQGREVFMNADWKAIRAAASSLCLPLPRSAGYPVNRKLCILLWQLLASIERADKFEMAIDEEARLASYEE